MQTVIEFVAATTYEKRKQERLVDSNERANTASIFLLAKDDPEVEDLLAEIVRCQAISKKYRNNALEKEVADYINGQVQRADSLSGKLDTLLKKLLTAGSFIFRGKPVAVSVLDADLLAAANKQLETAAEEVFEKYGEAPLQADGALAERLLKTSNLAQIASKDNPLGLVKTVGGKTSIDTKHRRCRLDPRLPRPQPAPWTVASCSTISSARPTAGRRTPRATSSPPCSSAGKSSSASPART